MDLTPKWDAERVLRNPHKGWFHHYYDNSTGIYLGTPEEIAAVPGLDHLYIRLPWSEFEPEEGKFDWRRIDETAAAYVPLGYRLGLSITCMETGIEYATPKWVKDLGCRGGFYENWGTTAWEPDYGDPVFLARLENFHRVFAKRYDGKPWVAYYDLSSYGCWGEGHTSFSSKRAPPVGVVKKHIDIHARLYRKTLLTVGDDWMKDRRSQEEEAELVKYVKTRGFAFRDDSLMVDYWLKECPATFSIHRPEYFISTAGRRPGVLEFEHYRHVKRAGNWKGPDGVERGAAEVRGAIDLTRATYIGYHGYAPEWLKENPNLTRELANRVGYWYFVKSVEIPDGVRPGERFAVMIEWLNRGVAPAYHRYALRIRISAPGGGREEAVKAADNRRWEPGSSVRETYRVALPKGAGPGEYALKVRLADEREEPPRVVELALKESLRDADGFYALGRVRVEE